MKNTTILKSACYSLFLFSFLLSFNAFGKSQKQESGLSKTVFRHFWKVEASDSLPYHLKFSHDTLEITTRGGLTLWRKQKLQGNTEISYSACVMDEGKNGDRLSDLNCFWMASDPLYPNNVFQRSGWRKGVFEKYYSLKMYYLGYGGNGNTTTRFRKYDGDWSAFADKKIRPAILSEYNDSQHLLKPNHWYQIRIVCQGNRIQYFIDGELLVDFFDQQPLKTGWFGFRTTWSRVRITNFRIENP